MEPEMWAASSKWRTEGLSKQMAQLVRVLYTKTGSVNQTTAPATVSGWRELEQGLYNWPVWYLLGSQELRHRYTRSRLGQVWLTLSTAIMICTVGAVWSLLWNQSLRDILPFFGIGIIMWTFLSQPMTECTGVFVAHGAFYRNQRMNLSVSIYAVIYRNSVVLAHNLVIVALLILAFGVPITWHVLQIVPALLLTWITMAWAGFLIAMVCVRYRDIIQIVTNFFTVFFFVTPVMWKPEFLAAKYHFIIDLNPLAQFLEILRNPFLGQPVSAYAWLMTTIIAIGGGILSLPVIGRYQRRVIFWV